MSADEEASMNFQEILTNAVGLAVGEVAKMFGDRIEIVESAEDLPETELMDRDEV